jgi:hypothetical protein
MNLAWCLNMTKESQMKSVTRFLMSAASSFAVCCLLTVVVMAQAGGKTQLIGSWNFNPDQSDDAQQKVQQAQQSSQRGTGGGAYPQGGGYPGGGGYPTGGGNPGTGGYPSGGMGRGGLGGSGMGRSGVESPDARVSSQEWAKLAANPKYINITQHDDQIVITDSDHTRILYPDGKKHKGTDESGDKTSTKTEWQGDELIAETKIGSGKLTDTYQVSSDGKQLIVVSRYENSSLSGQLSIRRAYDLGNGAH